IKKSDDKRMYFIRNNEFKNNNSGESHNIEYEVIVDARFVDEFNYDTYYITPWEITNKPNGEERRLCLRINQINYYTDNSHLHDPSYSFYYNDGLAEEIVALTSLFLRARMRLGQMVRWFDKPLIRPIRKEWIDKPLINENKILKELPDWFKSVEKLNPEYHEPFKKAAFSYQQALHLIENQPALAYLILVSAIETLSHSIDQKGKTSLFDLDNKLGTIVKKVECQELRQELEEAIINQFFKAKRKFIDFISEHVEESFWAKNNRQIHSNQLKDILGRIYDQRSKTIHTGEQFPPFIFMPPEEHESDIPIRENNKEENKCKKEDLIPYPQFFEELVRHVLISFVKNNQVQNEK
ncbi:MAG: hypothetical protein ACE14V_02865, partial [bacterium]